MRFLDSESGVFNGFGVLHQVAVRLRGHNQYLIIGLGQSFGLVESHHGSLEILIACQSSSFQNLAVFFVTALSGCFCNERAQFGDLVIDDHVAYLGCGKAEDYFFGGVRRIGSGRQNLANDEDCCCQCLPQY